MKIASLFLALVIVTSSAAHAQLPTKKYAGNQRDLLRSNDPRIAANKKLVYDFWREVIDARHMDLALKYMAESYIQHNPNVPTGRKAFIAFFSKKPPSPIQPVIREPLVAILGDGNLVTMVFEDKRKDPKDPNKSYTTTWFDMFRIEHGKIAEHWDCDVREK